MIVVRSSAPQLQVDCRAVALASAGLAATNVDIRSYRAN
jgi:hypothetical protein